MGKILRNNLKKGSARLMEIDFVIMYCFEFFRIQNTKYKSKVSNASYEIQYIPVELQKTDQ